MKIAMLIFLLLSAAAATFTKKANAVGPPNDKAQDIKVEPDTTNN
jgi:hypothetical protein